MQVRDLLIIRQTTRRTPNSAARLQNRAIKLHDLRWRRLTFAILRHVTMTKSDQNMAPLSNLSINRRVKRKPFQVFLPTICWQARSAKPRCLCA